MQDLVQMMTQTLHMDARDVSLPEFKLNRKYRDTLMLHGKSREGQGDFQISGFPLGNSLNSFFCFQEHSQSTQIYKFLKNRKLLILHF